MKNRLATLFVFAFCYLGILLCEQSIAQVRNKSSETTSIRKTKNTAQQESKRPSVNSAGLPSSSANGAVSPAFKKQLFGFVKENHPDLILLLDWLEKNRPKKHASALRSLARDYKRLKTIQKNSPKRYAYQLEQWNLKSRIQLCSVKVAIKDSPETRKTLKRMIVKQLDGRVNQLKTEQAKLMARVKKVNEQLRDAKKARQNDVGRQLEAAIQKAKRSKDRIQNNKKTKSSGGS